MNDDPLTPAERAAMAEADGYLSRNKPYLARLQRQRRAGMVRIDYMPSPAALAVIDAKRATVRPGSFEATASAILDAIIAEWAKLTGLNKHEVAKAMTPEFGDNYARARMTPAGGAPGIHRRLSGAYESGNPPPSRAHAGAYQSGQQHPARRVPCGAQRHRNGQPCQARPEPGKRRCRFHGGRSTGPKTDAGKAKALANLRQYRGE